MESKVRYEKILRATLHPSLPAVQRREQFHYTDSSSNALLLVRVNMLSSKYMNSLLAALGIQREIKQ